MDGCLSQEIIGRYVRQTCSPSEAQRVEAHITGCVQCRQQVEVILAGWPNKTADCGNKEEADPQLTQPLPVPDLAATVIVPRPRDASARPASPQTVFEGYHTDSEKFSYGANIIRA